VLHKKKTNAHNQQIIVLRDPEASNPLTPSTALQLEQIDQGRKLSKRLPKLPSTRYTRLARDRPQVPSLPKCHQAIFAVDPLPLSTFDIPSIVREPSLRFSRDTLWDTLILSYGSSRSVATQNVYDDLDHLFRISSFYFAFIHLPLFYSCLRNQRGRAQMQSALILSLLARLHLASPIASRPRDAGLTPKAVVTGQRP